MRVLIDTDVLLDIALERRPHLISSLSIFELAETGTLKVFLAWHSLANLAYLLRPKNSSKPLIDFLSAILKSVTVAEVGHRDALFALKLGFKDFEDALQVAAARSAKVDVIITRNKRDFKLSPIKVMTPKEFLELR